MRRNLARCLARSQQSRSAASGSAADLEAVLEAKINTERVKIANFRKEHGTKVLSQSTVDSCYAGMRGVTAFVYEPSLLDAQEGIRFRDLTIPDCQQKLTKFPGGTEPMPEAMLWLLLTGECPTDAQTKGLTQELLKRAEDNPQLVKEVDAVINALPKGLHPMSQLIIAISTLQKDSKFVQAYNAGVSKKEYWRSQLDDTLNCLARLTRAAALIYRRTYHDGKVAALDSSLDWTGNFVNQLGFKSPDFQDCMRLYLSIHVDHEGGNVSAHTVQLVGSALSDPYLSLAGGMAGLAGPLHGLANQEVLSFLLEIKALLDAAPPRKNEEEEKALLTKIIWEEVLNKGKVVPGYGHAVLRKTDPRYSCQREFALRKLPDFPLFKMVNLIYQIMPDILTQHGKTKNPYPNVDAHSGVLLQNYGLTEESYYTVLFGVSRAIGVLSALIWNRALGIPIERPKTMTTESLIKKFANQ